ncbi:helix-turn-helix domain-containing protein [Saccharothrix sp. NRRL B-16348]|uniref:helix-turn-helix domain-containing protein n=1 Tax=Saccharothrix sp. NRRL B-16348 TaxID=1415542 RepID=UPI0009E6ADF8
MRTSAATPTGGRGSRATGVVAGFVLKLSRQTAGLTQERFAELLGVDPTTVQGWESGRRPLAAVGAGELVKLSARLSRAGAPASTGRHLNEAIEADLVLATGITAGDSWVDPDHHPLAAAVHRKTITNLITWPLPETHRHNWASSSPRCLDGARSHHTRCCTRTSACGSSTT